MKTEQIGNVEANDRCWQEGCLGSLQLSQLSFLLRADDCSAFRHRQTANEKMVEKNG